MIHFTSIEYYGANAASAGANLFDSPRTESIPQRREASALPTILRNCFTSD